MDGTLVLVYTCTNFYPNAGITTNSMKMSYIFINAPYKSSTQAIASLRGP